MCLSPITIKNKNPNWVHPTQFLEVPCGKCYECVMTKRFNWCFRLEKELEKSKKFCYFATLTYDNDYLPYKQVLDFVDSNNHCHFVTIPCFDKMHVRNFIRSMRDKFRYECKKKNLDSSYFTSFKFFACSEYGFKSLRPHYHMLFFDVPFNEVEFNQIISDYWKYGFSKIGVMNPDRIYYTCKYILKQDFIDIPNLPKGSDRNFILCSKNLGLSFLTPEMVTHIIHKFYDSGDIRVRYHDKFVILPRYYRDKIFDGFERIQIAATLLDNYDRFARCPDSADPIEWLNNRVTKHTFKILENCELEIC